MATPVSLGEAGGRHHKAEIVLRLYVNGVPYEYGKLCEFCESSPATKHCPDSMCGFMCDSCDTFRHESRGDQIARYSNHERAKLSKLDIPTACFRVKGFMRFLYHRSRMREGIRREYSRYFDGRTKRHFYVFQRTQEVSWSRPRLLGTEELRPFLSPEEASFKIQQLYRNWKAREIARDRMRAAWSRVFSPQEGRYFFFYKGKSPLMLPTTSTWVQPCRSIGGIWVWRPVVTEDVAALKIQNAWRNFQGLRDIRRRVRQMYTLERDAFTGGECYRNLATGEVLSQKSVLLGNERWDQEDMLLWTVDEVATFIRRCGLKRLMPRIRHFKVDGALLMTFDPEDFMILGRIDSVHTKKVFLSIERRPAFNGYNKRPKDLLRRAALRQRHFEETQNLGGLVAPKPSRRGLMNGNFGDPVRGVRITVQAEKIQRWWGEVRRSNLRRLWKRTGNIARAKEERERKWRETATTWWTERVRDYSGLDASVKMFGRRRNILGVRGWGRWDPRGRKWTPAPEEVGAPHRSRLEYRDAPDHAALPVNTAKELLLEGDRERRREDRARTGLCHLNMHNNSNADNY